MQEDEEMGHIQGISHIAYNVADLEKSVDFYCNVLEFEKAFDILVPDNIDELLPGHPVAALKGQTSLVYLKAPDGSYLELFRPLPGADISSGGPNYDRMGYVHLSIIVDDLDAFTKVLREKGIPLDSEKTLGPDHTYTLWIKDPDGNRIELMEYTRDSYQVVYH